MNKHSEEYNKLPIEIRKIVSPVLIQTQITQLIIEKERVKKSYYRHMSEINDHIKNLEKALKP